MKRDLSHNGFSFFFKRKRKKKKVMTENVWKISLEITFSYFFLPFPLFEKEKRLVRELVGRVLRPWADAQANKCSRTINLFFSFSNRKRKASVEYNFFLSNRRTYFLFFVFSLLRKECPPVKEKLYEPTDAIRHDHSLSLCCHPWLAHSFSSFPLRVSHKMTTWKRRS